MGVAIPRRDLASFNGIGGFTRDGREYVDHHRRRATDAGAVGECAGQCRLRHGGESERIGLYVVRECIWIPVDALEQRLVGDGGRRGVLHPRRRERTVLVTDAVAGAGTWPYTTRHGFGYTIFEYSEETSPRR